MVFKIFFFAVASLAVPIFQQIIMQYVGHQDRKSNLLLEGML